MYNVIVKMKVIISDLDHLPSLIDGSDTSILKIFLTCKWILSFFSRDQTENNMQLCFNLLVLRCKFWYCIPKEVHLCCSLLLNSKNFRILTETGDIISLSIWAIFDKNSSLSLFKKNGGSLQKFSNLLLFQH